MCCLQHRNWSVHPCVRGFYSIWCLWFTPHRLLSHGAQNTQSWQHEVGNHTPATEPCQQWSLLVGLLFWCVPCLSLFLTYASDFIYGWVFEGEVTLIHTPGVILDELGTLSLVCRWVFFRYKEWSHGLGTGHHIYVNLKKKTRSQGLWCHSSTKWWKGGKNKSSPTLFSLFVPPKLY